MSPHRFCAESMFEIITPVMQTAYGSAESAHTGKCYMVSASVLEMTKGRTVAPSASLSSLSARAWMMGWSGLISSVLRPFMYSAARLSPSVCTYGSQLQGMSKPMPLLLATACES